MSIELESDVCYRVYGWRHLVKATEVAAGLAESNGSPPPGGWLKVTCGLTACTRISGLGPTLGNEYGRTFFTFTFCSHIPANHDHTVRTSFQFLFDFIYISFTFIGAHFTFNFLKFY